MDLTDLMDLTDMFDLFALPALTLRFNGHAAAQTFHFLSPALYSSVYYPN
jgi:hypothetical protein